MNRLSNHKDDVDALVERLLASEAERVDPEAFLSRLKARQRPVRRVLRLPLPLMAAAVVLLAALTVAVVLHGRARHAEPTEPGTYQLDLAALAPMLRGDLLAAWNGARLAGTAVVSATAEPFGRLRTTSLPLPRLPGLSGRTRQAAPMRPEESER